MELATESEVPPVELVVANYWIFEWRLKLKTRLLLVLMAPGQC